MKNNIIIFLVALWFLPCRALAQYKDYRTYFPELDSLEQVLATNPPEGKELRDIYFQLTKGYQGINTQKSMEYARKHISLSIPLNLWKNLANSYNVLGNNFVDISQYDSALVYYGNALDATERMNDFPKKYSKEEIDDNFSKNYGAIGNLYSIQGKNREAIEYYTKAMKLFEKHDWKESLTLVHSNIGEVYRSMDNYPQAKIHHIKADSLAHITGDSLHIAVEKYYFGYLYLDTKDYENALQNAEKAYEYFFSHPVVGDVKPNTLSLLSQIYLEGYGDDLRAEEYARQALVLLDKYNNPRAKAVSLSILSSVYLKRGQWRNAEQAALKALETDDSEPVNTLACYRILSKVYSHQGNAVKVDEYFDKYASLQSSWSTANYQSAIREMEVKYDTEKKEQKITVLEERQRFTIWLSISTVVILLLALVAFFFFWRWAVQKRQLAESHIQQLEQEKQLIAAQSLLDGETRERSRLARDLHDGLGSILASTKINLLEMKKDATLEYASLERYNSALDLLDKSMSEMRRVAHHLMPETLASAGLKQSVADFIASIPNATFSYYGDESRFDSKLEETVYRIAHELVTNALKHSGAEQILVDIVRYDNHVTLAVQDDGCGFDPDAASSNGMGMNNIRTRVNAFNGNLTIVSKQGVGTEANVEFVLN